MQCEPSGSPLCTPSASSACKPRITGSTLARLRRMITKRPERLKGVDYCGFHRYFLTICTAYRRHVFVASEIVEAVRMQLQEAGTSNGFGLPADCFMPDHLHALVVSGAENADFRHFVRMFKQSSSYAYRRKHEDSLWQPGYHERILRNDEATEAVVRYIWENPIRAGITKELGEYPFCGSDCYQLADIIDVWQRDRRT